MPHTVWRGTELLGEGDCAPLTAVPGALAGPFRPTAAFAAVWPVFDAWRTAQRLYMAGFATPSSGATPDEIRARLVEAEAGSGAAAAFAAVAALGLEVRNALGDPLRDVHIAINGWTPPPFTDLTPAQRADADREAAEAGVTLGGPNYFLVLTPVPGRGATQAGSSAGAV